MPRTAPESEPVDLLWRVHDLEAELSECRATLDAIQRGEIDALVVTASGGERRVYTLESADRPYRFLIEQMHEGAVTLGRDGAVLYGNRMAAGLLGVTLENLVGRDLRLHLAPKDAKWLTRLLGRRAPAGARAEITLRTADGGEVPVQLSVSPLRDDEMELFCAVLTDLRMQKQHLSRLAEVNERLKREIAERERTEDVLRQAQKMQAVGQLTGGIAHDFNNMLQGVAGGVELARRRIARGHPEEADRYLDLAGQSIERAGSLTQRLLSFSRRQMYAERRIDIDHLMRSVSGIIQQTLGPEILLELKLRDGCWPVKCDANQLENALLNIAINARDAMLPEGGTLLIETDHVILSKLDLVGWPSALPGEFVRITLSDTGAGMSPETLAHVFEPFFTTKPAGGGTGLGLSQVYGYVTHSGGVVRLDSALGRGTAAHLYFPRDHTPAVETASPAANALPDLTLKSSMRVLLVDDEVNVRQLMAEGLQERGYVITEAGNGPTALKAILQTPQGFDILVSDVGLPGGMNGRQLAEVARDRLPDLPVLLITGYAGDAIETLLTLPRGVEVLRKPFTLNALVVSVERVLRSAPPAP